MNQVLQRSPSADGVRDVDDVPYVELFDGRAQGVVSSGSDPNRVYVSFVAAGTLAFNCSTNNNRPCGGLRGGPCKHIAGLVDEAVAQYGGPAVARYLKIPGDPDTVTAGHDVMRHVRGGQSKVPVSEVFSRFLFDLRFVELDAPEGYCPEMAWFVG
ncbi:MAG: hypothetical protein ABMA64_25790 [Myxococcota bacterium]